MAPVDTQSPPRGNFLPRKIWIAKALTGSKKIGSSKFSIIGTILSPHLVRLIDINELPVLVKGEDNRQNNRGFGRRENDDEDGKDLPIDEFRGKMRKSHQVDVGGIEDQLHPHEDGDAVPFRHDGKEAEGKEHGDDGQSPRAGHAGHDRVPEEGPSVLL